jgi:hypothetical protein
LRKGQPSITINSISGDGRKRSEKRKKDISENEKKM